MAITDKEQGVWELDQVYNKINQGGIWNYTSDGTSLWAWGRNYLGGLGITTPGSVSSPTQIAGTTWKELACAQYRGAMAFRTDGTLWTWGEQSWGSLGHNNNTTYSSPRQVGTDTTWSTGVSSLAVKTNGTLWSWGNNSNGNMGTNDKTNRSSPTQIGANTNWATGDCLKLARGMEANNFCGAIKTDGTLWVWCNSAYGCLGQNSAYADRSSPTQLGTETTWSEIATTLYGGSVRALKTDGTLWVWGRNDMGQLGQNNLTNYSSPRQLGTSTDWSTVGRGGNYHMHAVKTDGTLWGIGGYNSDGNLGQNTTNYFSSPVQIPGTNWKMIDGTERTTLGSKTDGTLWSWGLSNYGALGLNQGPGTNRSSPTQIPGAWHGGKGQMASNYWDTFALRVF